MGGPASDSAPLGCLARAVLALGGCVVGLALLTSALGPALLGLATLLIAWIASREAFRPERLESEVSGPTLTRSLGWAGVPAATFLVASLVFTPAGETCADWLSDEHAWMLLSPGTHLLCRLTGGDGTFPGALDVYGIALINSLWYLGPVHMLRRLLHGHL